MATKVKLSYEGVGQLLRGEEMMQLMGHMGAETANRCGTGYDYRVHNTGQRQAVNVYPVTRAASKDNMENNTLLKSL